MLSPIFLAAVVISFKPLPVRNDITDFGIGI